MACGQQIRPLGAIRTPVQNGELFTAAHLLCTVHPQSLHSPEAPGLDPSLTHMRCTRFEYITR